MRKMVLITGAGTGLGLACVELFLENKWDVLAHFHESAASLERIQKNIRMGRLEFIKSDFRHPAEITRFVTLVNKYKIDALVNNAAQYDHSHKSKNRIKAINDLLTVNVIAPTLIAKAVLDQMKSRKQGQIVNISSIGAKYGSESDNIFYGVSKRGLESATRTLAKEGATHNVLVNTVRPGVMDTNVHRKIKKDMDLRRRLIPLKRIADPREVARLIYFLCAHNTYITNETLTISGGE